MKSSQNSERPIVSFLIINWKSEDVTAQCVKSIWKSDTNLAFEVIVFDNESTPESAKYLSKLDAKILTSEKNLGFGEALNRAAKNALGKYLAFINNDAIIPQNWLNVALNHIEQPNIGAVGGLEYLWDGGETKKGELYSIPRVSSKNLLVNQSKALEKTSSVPYVTASNMLIRKDTFLDVGGFDPKYFLYYEDMDLCAKVINQGLKIIYADDLYIWHRVNYSSNKNGQKYFHIFKNRFRIIAKFFPDNKWRAVFFYNAVGDIFMSSLLFIVACILTIFIREYYTKAVIHRSKIRASIWAMKNFNSLNRDRNGFSKGSGLLFYKTIMSQRT